MLEEELTEITSCIDASKLQDGHSFLMWLLSPLSEQEEALIKKYEAEGLTYL